MANISCFPGGSVVKNLTANTGDAGDSGSIPGSGRSPGEGNSNPLQYSCLENPIDREAWQVTVHWVAKSWARLSTSMEFLAHLLGCRHWSKGFICAKWLHWGQHFSLWGVPTFSSLQRGSEAWKSRALCFLQVSPIYIFLWLCHLYWEHIWKVFYGIYWKGC